MIAMPLFSTPPPARGCATTVDHAILRRHAATIAAFRAVAEPLMFTMPVSPR